MARTIVKASTVSSGYECDCYEHLKETENVSHERVTKVVIEIAKEQRESYVKRLEDSYSFGSRLRPYS